MINPYEPARDPSESSENTVARIRRRSIESRSLLTDPLTAVTKTLLGYAGIFVPIVSFFVASGGIPEGPKWQTGFLGDKLSYALSAHAGFVLYPFLLIAVGCFTWYLVHEKTHATRMGVRIVLFGGALLSLFYTVVLWLVLCRSVDMWLTLAAAQVGFPCLVLGLPWLARRLPFRVPPAVKFGLLGLLFLGFAFALATEPRNAMAMTLGITIGFPIAASLFCGPVWALFAYGFVSFRIAYDPKSPHQASEMDWVASLAYGIGILGAMPLSIRLSWIQYSRLPVSPPPGDCYVVTAAARGHQSFVGSWIEIDDGGTTVVNQQLRRLRAFEQMTMHRWPRLHGLTRRFYNCVGPQMAGCLGNAWLADLAYLSLKPIEWIAVVILSRMPPSEC